MEKLIGSNRSVKEVNVEVHYSTFYGGTARYYAIDTIKWVARIELMAKATSTSCKEIFNVGDQDNISHKRPSRLSAQLIMKGSDVKKDPKDILTRKDRIRHHDQLTGYIAD